MSEQQIGLCGAIFLIFLTLKLVGVDPVAGWSWWWVTAPIWIPLAIAFFLLLLAVALKWLGDVLERRERRL